jgi:hypothetical protein
VDGRHKAGHDDSGVVRGVAYDLRKRTIFVSFIPSILWIVMAGLVPAIHVFLSSRWRTGPTPPTSTAGAP